MSTVRLLVSTRSTPGSALIRLATWSDYSHVALIDGDTVIEAVTGGVRRAPLGDAIDHADAFGIAFLPCRDPQAVIAAAASQIGKPYDWTAIAGIGLHRDWQEEDSWFCSELVAWAFERAGEPLFRADCLRRVTPQHLWMLAPVQPPRLDWPTINPAAAEIEP